MKISQNQTALLLRKNSTIQLQINFSDYVCIDTPDSDLVTQKEISKYFFLLKRQIIMIVSAAIG